MIWDHASQEKVLSIGTGTLDAQRRGCNSDLRRLCGSAATDVSDAAR